VCVYVCVCVCVVLRVCQGLHNKEVNMFGPGCGSPTSFTLKGIRFHSMRASGLQVNQEKTLSLTRMCLVQKKLRAVVPAKAFSMVTRTHRLLLYMCPRRCRAWGQS
jgi:hypothetical protein